MSKAQLEVASRMGPEFVHLHTHSYFSLLAGLAAPEALAERAAELGQSSLALTDYNNMFGAVRFYRAARAAGIKPIFGLQLSVGAGGHPLTLLAQTNAGFRNLLRLATAVRTERPARWAKAESDPRFRTSPGSVDGAAGILTPDPMAMGSAYRDDGKISRQFLYEHREGLFVLSGGSRGELTALLRAGRKSEATEFATELRDTFGRDNFFIELQNQGLPGQTQLNATLVALARRLNVGVVATNDVRYLHTEDASAHAALLAMAARTTLTNPDRPSLGSAEFCLTSAVQMQERFHHLPEALANTALIARRCDVELDMGRLRLPAFRKKIDAENDGKSSYDARASSLLEQRTWAGARERFGPNLPEGVKERLKHELAIIGGRRLASYFLIVADIVDEAKRRGILVGPGRGSAASSLVAHCLGITAVDPLQHGLLFERFLNPEREHMPDIDIDVADDRRDELLAYVRQRFGGENVAHIITFGTLAARAALRETGKVLGIARATIDRVARLIPSDPGATLEQAERKVPALTRALRADVELQRLFRLARAVEGIPRHVSVHAAGIVIGDKPLGEDLPLIVTSDRLPVTQWAMNDVEALGFLKMDLLGLRTLAVIDRVRAHVPAEAGERAVQRAAEHPLDDASVYEALRKRGTAGIFQLETPMFRNLVHRLQPTTFADIVALLALGRPGPMQRVEEYIRRRHGRAPVRYADPALEPILKETYGIIVYQEQVMHIAIAVAGYSAAEADLLRRRLTDIGEALPAEERQRFLRGAQAQGIDSTAAQRIWDELMQYAGYGFAKSHSVAYALLTYETAWWRTYFPAAFWAALLTSHIGNPDRIRRYVSEAAQVGTTVLRPDVNTSGVDFEAVVLAPGGEQAVSFGLAGIPHVGRAAAERIVAARQEKPFSSFDEFCQRVSTTNRVSLLRALIEAGACDGFGMSRDEMVAVVESSSSAARPRQRSLFSPGAAGAPTLQPEISDMITEKHSGFVLQLAAGQERYWSELRGLLAAHKGSAPVTIKVPTAAGTVSIAVDRRLWVDGSPQLLEQLRRWMELGRLTSVIRKS